MDSQPMKNEIVWSDDLKIEQFGLYAKYYIWMKLDCMTSAQMSWCEEAFPGTGKIVVQ